MNRHRDIWSSQTAFSTDQLTGGSSPSIQFDNIAGNAAGLFFLPLLMLIAARSTAQLIRIEMYQNRSATRRRTPESSRAG